MPAEGRRIQKDGYCAVSARTAKRCRVYALLVAACCCCEGPCFIFSSFSMKRKIFSFSFFRRPLKNG